ncbi:MAG: nucleotidyltransferase family protein [Thermodesulfobacteriota bacterium]
MKAVILCAGFATRLYPLTENFPKPLLPVAGQPVLHYLIEQIKDLPGLEEVHIVTNAKFFGHFEDWRRAWSDQNRSGLMAVYLHNSGATENENRSGALADLQFVLKNLGSPEKILVSAGDNIYRFSFETLWDRFREGGDHYVVALPEKDPLKLKKTGVLELGEDNRVLDLHEKPESPASEWFCPPLYFFQPSAWGLLDGFLNVEKRMDAPGHFISFLCKKEPVYAFKPTGFRIDIGSLEDYWKAEERIGSRADF